MYKGDRRPEDFTAVSCRNISSLTDSEQTGCQQNLYCYVTLLSQPAIQWMYMRQSAIYYYVWC